jgi:adenylate kinase
MNLVIIGPSGSGKGTQAKLIAQKYGLTHISTGQLIRQEIKKQSSLGKKAQSYVERGVWTPTKIVLKILFSKLKTRFIIDGTPRYLKQCPLLDRYLEKHGQKLDAVIYLHVTKEELLARRRLYQDKFQDQSRPDATDQAFEARYQSGKKTLGSIKDYYRKQNKLILIDGNRPVKPIFVDIVKAISSL